MTEYEKQIYNTYLATTRSKQNKPFTLRKDFTDIKEAPIIRRISNFFKKYPHIKPSEFFAAPYEIHTDTGHLGIDYYLTRPAIKCYSLYQKKLQDVSPDLQIEDIRKSFQFIGSYCLRNRLQLHEYLTHKSGCIYAWMMHYREHNINIYSLFELGDLLTFLSKVSADEKAILTDDLQQTITKFKVRYFNSAAVKAFVREGTDKLKKFLKNSLTAS